MQIGLGLPVQNSFKQLSRARIVDRILWQLDYETYLRWRGRLVRLGLGIQVALGKEIG